MKTRHVPLDLLQKFVAAVQASEIRNEPLSAVEYQVYLQLLQRQNTKSGRCNPSQTRLAKDTGRSVRAVQKALRKLEQRGLIRIIKMPRGMSHAYQLRPPEAKVSQANEETQTDELVVAEPANPRAPKKENKKISKRCKGDEQRHNGRTPRQSNQMQRAAQGEMEIFSEMRARGIDDARTLSLPSALLLQAIEDRSKRARPIRKICDALVLELADQ